MPRLKIVFEMVNSHSGQCKWFELYREEPVIDWEAQIVIVQFHKRRPILKLLFLIAFTLNNDCFQQNCFVCTYLRSFAFPRFAAKASAWNSKRRLGQELIVVCLENKITGGEGFITIR